jgi:hypothetical protein
MTTTQVLILYPHLHTNKPSFAPYNSEFTSPRPVDKEERYQKTDTKKDTVTERETERDREQTLTIKARKKW